MANKTSNKKTKRPSKGQRTYVRRLKQAARKEASINNPHSSPAKPVRVPEKQDQT